MAGYATGMAKGRHIAVVTGTRAEYGLLEPVMEAIAQRGRLSVIVAGMHLVAGTWRDVRFDIAAKVRMQKRGATGRAADVEALGRGVIGFGKAFNDLNPDVVVVLGDRIEAFAAATAASVGGYHLAHIHGGDRAEGVADEAMRHAVSKLAHLHLAATAQSARRLIRMGEDPGMVFNVGSPAVSGLRAIEPMDDAALAKLGVDAGKPFVVVMQHPCGLSEAQEKRWMTATLRATAKMQRVVMSPNHDPGRGGVLAALRAATVQCIDHLPRQRFIAMLKRAKALVGNSSAGLIEAAAVGLPVVNVGPRQGGRQRAGNVVDVAEPQAAAIARAVEAKRRRMGRHPYGDGLAHERVAEVVCGAALGRVRKRNVY